MSKNARNYTVVCSVKYQNDTSMDSKPLEIILLVGQEFNGRQQRRLETDHLKYAEFAIYDYGGPTKNILRYPAVGGFDPSHRVTQEAYQAFKEACDILHKQAVRSHMKMV